MHRCQPASLLFTLRPALSALAASLALCGAVGMAHAQQVPDSLGSMRNFPDAALRGTLAFDAQGRALLNGTPVRTAPGFRLLNPQNGLVMVHTVHGQSFSVNYVLENSTGMLHTAWVLSAPEAAVPRAGHAQRGTLRPLFDQ